MENTKATRQTFFSFTAKGDFLAILSCGVVRIWNTSSGDLLAEWKDSDGDSGGNYTCVAFSLIKKKHRKPGATFLLAIGTVHGDIFALNVIAGEKMWISERCHCSGVTAIRFATKGRTLYSAGHDGVVYELDSRTGGILGKFKASKKPIASLVLSNDEEYIVVGSDKIRVFRTENKEETGKFSTESAPFHYIACSDFGKAVVSSPKGERQLYLWLSNQEKKSGTLVGTLYTKKPLIMLECRNSSMNDGLVVLSISEAGTAYVWNFLSISEADDSPSRIIVRSDKARTDQQKGAKKNQIPIIAAKLHDPSEDGQISLIVAYGSPSNPQFDTLKLANTGKVVLTARDDTSGREHVGLQVNGYSGDEVSTDVKPHTPNSVAADASDEKRVKKKRMSSVSDLGSLRNHIAVDDTNIDYDMNEPTMGEKLSILNLNDEPSKSSQEKPDKSSIVKPPRADSIYVLLKQALHADDPSLLMECLCTQDEKVIANTLTFLNPSDVIKFLEFLTSMIYTRGGMLSCAILWLRSLLLQHVSGIISQDSSLHIVNSLYQLINSRVSTYGSALELSNYLDFLSLRIAEEAGDEDEEHLPSTVEADDGSSEEASEDETDASEKSEDDEMVASEESEEFEPSENEADAFDSDGAEDMSE